MIHYLVPRGAEHGMRHFRRTWGHSLADRIGVRFYDQLRPDWRPRDGAVIFADLERLSPDEIARVAIIWDQLKHSGARLLNNPRRVLRRKALSDVLADHGINDFRSFRASDQQRPDRFPVFLRGERDHYGSRTPLLGDQAGLDDALARRTAGGDRLEGLLIVEFVDVSDRAGIYRKYSAFRLGRRILPRHLLLSDHWMVKVPGIVNDEKIAAEREYLETNPHREELKRIFSLAHVDYGRIDYALTDDGRIQVWEINTNPWPLLKRSEYTGEQIPNQRLFARRYRAALRSLAAAPPRRSRATPPASRLRVLGARLARPRRSHGAL